MGHKVNCKYLHVVEGGGGAEGAGAGDVLRERGDGGRLAVGIIGVGFVVADTVRAGAGAIVAAGDGASGHWKVVCGGSPGGAIYSGPVGRGLRIVAFCFVLAT